MRGQIVLALGTADAVRHLGHPLKAWPEVQAMRAEIDWYLPRAGLICLGGKGLEVARHLAEQEPSCPVWVEGEGAELLREAGWGVVEEPVLLCPDALDRMQLSLTGLCLGDALGEMLSHGAGLAPERLKGELPPAPWYHTDDTEMALSVVAVLRSHGRIDQDALARRFVRRFQRDPERGYGKMTRLQLRELAAGGDWREESRSAFGGKGSMGNGGAMRVAPLGAFFADDLDRCAEEARASCLVTHSHPEAVAGAIAVAVAAALACRPPADFLMQILAHTPESEVRRKLIEAHELSPDTPVHQAARRLGNGFQVTAADTVPFCLWMAAHHGHDFPHAVGLGISVDGDCDTNAAIIAGIVALKVGQDGIPDAWRKSAELYSGRRLTM